MSLQLRSRDGSEYLIQHDSEAIISTWYKAIGEGIQELVSRLVGMRWPAEELCPPWVGHQGVSAPPCRRRPPVGCRADGLQKK